MYGAVALWIRNIDIIRVRAIIFIVHLLKLVKPRIFCDIKKEPLLISELLKYKIRLNEARRESYL